MIWGWWLEMRVRCRRRARDPEEVPARSSPDCGGGDDLVLHILSRVAVHSQFWTGIPILAHEKNVADSK